MKRTLLFFLLIFFFGISSYAQKMVGFGGELSVLSLKPNVRMWVSKATGLEVFGGIASQIADMKPDDLEAGFKFLHAFLYNRTDRTYYGIVGKWKWAKGYDPNYQINLPIAGFLIGKEWYSKRINRKGFAVELGYQIGSKEYEIFSPIGHIPLNRTGTFNEFPLILNLRYTFYRRK